MTTEEFEKLTEWDLPYYALAKDAAKRTNVKKENVVLIMDFIMGKLSDDVVSFDVGDEWFDKSMGEACFNINEWFCHWTMFQEDFPKEEVELLLNKLSDNEDFPFKNKLAEYKEFLEHSKDEAYWEEHKEPREPINLDDYDVDHLPF